jgi:type 1 glutamine amidotransferase
MAETKIGRREALRALGMGAAVLAVGVPARAAAKKRILMVTYTAGFHHDSIPVGEETVKMLGDQSAGTREAGAWDVEYAKTADDVRTMITPAVLPRYDLVLFGSTTGELPITDDGKTAFMEWLRGGKGFVGVHSATDTLYQWPEYGRILGGYFNGHPWHQEVVIRVEDPNHPATRGLGASFKMRDEIYQFKNWTRQDKRVLLSIDPSSVDISRGARPDNDYAVAWVRSEGKGRVFYTSLGHEKAVWQDPRYQQHLLGGIRWALGLARGSTTPLPAPVLSQ